jgi:hypothetical protein
MSLNFIEDWGGFERLIEDLHRTGTVNVQRDVTLTGSSGAPRQIDVLVTHRTGLYEHRILVECKYWKHKVKRAQVDAMVSAVADLSASKGVIFTTQGFQSGAIEMARNRGVDLFLVRELTEREWGLPGRVIDLYIQTFYRALGNVRLTLSHAPSQEIQVILGKTHTTLAREDGTPAGSLEETLDKESMKILQKNTEKGFLINGGEECTRYLLMPVVLDFNPIRFIGQTALFSCSFDMGVKVSQTRLQIDRAQNYMFALAIENRISGQIHLGSKRKTDSDTSIIEYRPTPARDEDILKNGSILRVYMSPWFDFSETAGLESIPFGKHA